MTSFPIFTAVHEDVVLSSRAPEVNIYFVEARMNNKEVSDRCTQRVFRIGGRVGGGCVWFLDKTFYVLAIIDLWKDRRGRGGVVSQCITPYTSQRPPPILLHPWSLLVDRNKHNGEPTF